MQIARAQTLFSDEFPATNAPLPTGTLQLGIGGQSFDITLDSGNATLSGLADAINAQITGVSAQVQGSAGQYRLILKGPVGAAGAFTLSGLPAFTFPGTMGGLTQAQAAQDAVFKVDGVPYQRATNSINDIIPGLTLTLKKAAPGDVISLSSNSATAALRTTVSDFVTAFGDVRKKLADVRATAGSRAIVEMDRKLSRLLAQPLTSVSVGPRSLADLGVMTNRDGSVTLDTKKLDAMLRDWPDAVEAMFSPQRDATHNAASDPGVGGAMEMLRKDVLASNGPLDALKARLQKDMDALTALRNRTEDQASAYKDRLSRNFTSMDTRVAALKATQSYLEQQVAQWNRS